MNLTRATIKWAGQMGHATHANAWLVTRPTKVQASLSDLPFSQTYLSLSDNLYLMGGALADGHSLTSIVNDSTLVMAVLIQ